MAIVRYLHEYRTIDLGRPDSANGPIARARHAGLIPLTYAQKMLSMQRGSTDLICKSAAAEQTEKEG